MIKLRKRPESKNPVHKLFITEDKLYIIQRLKHPHIEVLYNPETKEGKLYSYRSPSSSSKENNKLLNVDDAVKKAIAWAKHNIKL